MIRFLISDPKVATCFSLTEAEKEHKRDPSGDKSRLNEYNRGAKTD
jgi:hypothetical protein